MQVPGSNNAGPGSDILGPELMSEEKETLLEKMKATGRIFELNFILSQREQSRDVSAVPSQFGL